MLRSIPDDHNPTSEWLGERRIGDQGRNRLGFQWKYCRWVIGVCFALSGCCCADQDTQGQGECICESEWHGVFLPQGSFRLATALAHKGYIVAAVNHPGTTTHDRSPQAAAQLWQRPADLSRAIDAVLAQPQRFGEIATGRVAVVGHSLGGWTALEIGGARFDPERFDLDCKVHTTLASCSVYQQINPASTPDARTRLAADLRDKRVTSIVSLDLGQSRGMTDASLAALPVPTLVIAAGAPSADLPAELESANLARRLPPASSRYVEISDASHFSFLSLCKPGAVAMLEEDVPGDGIICQDGEGGRSRVAIQQQVIGLIDEFLAQPLITTQR